jgi:AraC-like DNA-binding protein
MSYDLQAIYWRIARRIQTSPMTSLEDIAKDLQINRHTLLKAVKLATGKTFREFKSSFRIEEISKRISTSPESSLKEISFLVGYGSQRSLSRFVRERVGKSPKMLR